MITITPIGTPTEAQGRWNVAASADTDATAYVPTAFADADTDRVVVIITPVNAVARIAQWIWTGWRVTEGGEVQIQLEKSEAEGSGLAADTGTPTHVQVTAYVAP